MARFKGHSRIAKDVRNSEELPMRLRIFSIVVVLAGILLSLFVVFFKSATSLHYVSSTIELAGPWILASVLLLWLKWYRGVALAGVPMLLLEIYIYYGVFINPGSSTDAVAYAYKWIPQVIFLIVGLPIGRVIDKRIAEAKTAAKAN
jgi:hypothetical protein